MTKPTRTRSQTKLGLPFFDQHTPRLALVPRPCLALLSLIGLLTFETTLYAQEDNTRAGISLENGQLILTRSVAPDSPDQIRVWWNTEEPNRGTAVPFEAFTPSVEPDDSLRLLTEIDVRDFDRAFFFIGVVQGASGLTTDLSGTPDLFAESAGARLLVTIDLGAGSENYQGALDFTINGYGELYGQPLPLMQTATFNGRTQTVAVLDLDDREVTGPQTILLRLDDAQVSDAAEVQKVITIEDDDYFWSGAVDVGHRQFPIRIKWTKANGEDRLTYLSDGSGVIPAGEYEESAGAPIADLSTPLIIPGAISGSGPGGSDADLTLTFGDLQGEETKIEGNATVTLTYASAPHLDTASTGTFILRREAQPVRDREPALIQ